MKKILFLFLISIQINAQDILRNEDIIAKENIFYRKDNNEIFSGIVQYFKGNKLTYEATFENGKVIKSTKYYNSKNQIILYELYYDGFGTLLKQIDYSKDHKEKWTKYFDIHGLTKTIEEIKNEKLISRCEYFYDEK